MAVRIEKGIDMEAISGRILLEYFQSLGVILDLGHTDDEDL
jgi:hypothetical protein